MRFTFNKFLVIDQHVNLWKSFIGGFCNIAKTSEKNSIRHILKRVKFTMFSSQKSQKNSRKRAPILKFCSYMFQPHKQWLLSIQVGINYEISSSNHLYTKTRTFKSNHAVIIPIRRLLLVITKF